MAETGLIYEMRCSVQNITLVTESKKPVILILEPNIYHRMYVQEQRLSQILRIRTGNSRQAWKPKTTYISLIR